LGTCLKTDQTTRLTTLMVSLIAPKPKTKSNTNNKARFHFWNITNDPT
jgi:hypothetical protein